MSYLHQTYEVAGIVTGGLKPGDQRRLSRTGHALYPGKVERLRVKLLTITTLSSEIKHNTYHA